MRTLIFGLTAFAALEAQAVTLTGTVAAGDLFGVEFTLGGTAEWLDITTNGSTYVRDGGGADTVIGLFAGAGPGAVLIASDDDDGIDRQSFLSFGPDGRAASEFPTGFVPGPPSSTPFSGDGGSLNAGTYTLVIARYFGRLPANGTTLSNFGTPSGTLDIALILDITSDADLTLGAAGRIVPVPAPAGGGLLVAALGALGLRRWWKERGAA